MDPITDPANFLDMPHWMQLAMVWMKHQQFVATLLLLMVLDVACGVMLALARKTLSSSMSFRGMAKKGTMLILLGLSSAIEPFANGVPLLGPTALYFIVTEAISILEHAGALGVPLPPVLLEALAKLREQKILKAGPTGLIGNPTQTQPIEVKATIETHNSPPA